MNLFTEKKTDFFVVIHSPLLSDSSFETAVRSFIKFYNSLTPKHLKRVHLVVLDPSPDRAEMIERSNMKYDAESVLYVLNSLQSQAIDDIKRQKAIVFHPTKQVTEASRVEILSDCLPILTYDNWSSAYSFDIASCIYLPVGSEEQPVREFSNLMRMLFYDQGALKMLQDKARNHRRSVSARVFSLSHV